MALIFDHSQALASLSTYLLASLMHYAQARSKDSKAKAVIMPVAVVAWIAKLRLWWLRLAYGTKIKP